MKIIIAATMCAVMMGGQVALAQPPSSASSAQDIQPQFLVEPPIAAALPEPANPVRTANPGAEQPLDLDQLSDLRGGETTATQLTSQNLNAVNTGNSISAGESVSSGAVNLNANAFNGYDGIGNFVINTGHNNNLMGSVSVNVLVTPQ